MSLAADPRLRRALADATLAGTFRGAMIIESLARAEHGPEAARGDQLNAARLHWRVILMKIEAAEAVLAGRRAEAAA